MRELEEIGRDLTDTYPDGNQPNAMVIRINHYLQRHRFEHGPS
jgi:hypothetical protein